jgi:hypothetical protein
MSHHFENEIAAFDRKTKTIAIVSYAALFLLFAWLQWFLEDEKQAGMKWLAVGLFALNFVRDIWRMNRKAKVTLHLTADGLVNDNPSKFESRNLQWKNIKWVQVEPLAIHFFSQSSFRNTVSLKDFKPEDVTQVQQLIKTILTQHQIQLVDKACNTINNT